MGQMGEWIPPGAPLSEGYWEAILRDGEYGEAVSAGHRDSSWNEEALAADVVETTVEEEGGEDRWEEARRLMRQGEILELPVVGCNRGGLLVGWNGIQGFVPASHLLDLSGSVDEEDRQAELRSFIGTQMRLKIIELDRERRRFVLSQRATRVDADQREQLLSSLRPGDICRGRVTNLCSFGAFVDLGGFEGLVHISELSWGRVDRPSDVLDPDQEVDVYVLDVDTERERVGLSVKRLQPDPWQFAEDRYHTGQMVDGAITHLVDFGAFVQIEEGLEGLIHVSELAEGQYVEPDEVVQEGDAVVVEILSVDGGRRRMGLRLQEVKETERDEGEAKGRPGAQDVAAEGSSSSPIAQSTASSE